MRKTTKIVIGMLIVGILLLGIGYAAIQNITLNISGTATADPSQSNFSVKFLNTEGSITVSDEDFITAEVTDDINATINVSGLSVKGERVSAVYTIENASLDLSADLSVSTTNSNPDYFIISSQLEDGKTSLVAGEKLTLTVVVELTQTPMVETVSASIGVELIATAVQPGEEGSSGATNDFSQTPDLPSDSLVSAKIGEYIDLGNNIIGEETTEDDWRILYVDESEIYVILADYLPAEQVPVTAGLDTYTDDYVYGVWSDSDSDTLISGLSNETAWSSFANGIEGAIATGSPTAELLMDSYNSKNGTELSYEDYPDLDDGTEDYDLYVPHTDAIDDCYGYWLVSTDENIDGSVRTVSNTGLVYSYNYDSPEYSARPVVTLPIDTAAQLIGGVWIVEF